MAHIIAKRGMAFVDCIPEVLRRGELVRDKAGLKRAYLVVHPDPAHVLVIRLDWDGRDKTWLVTSFTDDKGKFAGNKGTSDILDSCAAMLASDDADKVCVPAATRQTSEKSIGANDENVKIERNELTKEDQDMFGAVERASRSQVLQHLEAPVDAPGASIMRITESKRTTSDRSCCARTLPICWYGTGVYGTVRCETSLNACVVPGDKQWSGYNLLRPPPDNFPRIDHADRRVTQ